MSAIEFEAWPKIPRLNRDIVITEKIDGTNAAVLIVERDGEDESGHPTPVFFNDTHAVFAQSRTRFITPENDNYGFARWVKEHADALAQTLGAGRHFGEWWGSGIQRGYGLRSGDKRFSLFNTHRWDESLLAEAVPALGVVPVLYSGPFSEAQTALAAHELRVNGSWAAPGFERPEGIIVYHTALRSSFKVTLEGDEAPKSALRKMVEAIA